MVLVCSICGWFVFGGFRLYFGFFYIWSLIRICGFVVYCWWSSGFGLFGISVRWCFVCLVQFVSVCVCILILCCCR